MSANEEHSPDSDLVRLAKDGDETAFSELFERYFERIRVFAYRIVLNHENATDIAQESFIKAARQIRTLREGQSFQSWIYKICSNSARDHLRSTKSYAEKLDTFGTTDYLRPASFNDPHEASERTRQLLQSLPPEQREALVLVYLEECSHSEAGRRIGCAESIVSWRIYLAKRKLRKLITP